MLSRTAVLGHHTLKDRCPYILDRVLDASLPAEDFNTFEYTCEDFGVFIMVIILLSSVN